MEKKILNIINNIRQKNNQEALQSLNESMSLRKDLGFDSFDLAELTVRIEDEFGIDIFEDSIIDTINEILIKINCGNQQ